MIKVLFICHGRVSCTINRTLVNWGRVGHNMEEKLGITTV